MSKCDSTGVITLSTCVACGSMPSGFISIIDCEGNTLDVMKFNSGSRRIGVDCNKSPLFGYIPKGEYSIPSLTPGYDTRSKGDDHFLLENAEFNTKHFLFHHTSPSYPAPGGICIPGLLDWKRLQKLVSSGTLTSLVFN